MKCFFESLLIYLLLLSVANAHAKFPKTFWIGIDDGEPTNQSQVQEYLIEPVIKKFNPKGRNDGWGLKPLVDQYFAKHPQDKRMLNIWYAYKDSSTEVDLYKEGAALGLFRLGNASHFEIQYPGTKEVVIEMSLTWVLLGTKKGATRYGVAPEIRLTRTVFASCTYPFDKSALGKYYESTFFKTLEKLMSSVRKAEMADSGGTQIPVMIENMFIGKSSLSLVDEYLKTWSCFGDKDFVREKFVEELKLYLQVQLIKAIEESNNPALGKISLLPPKGVLDFLQNDWDHYLSHLDDLGYKDESRLPEPILKEVGYACDYNQRESDSGAGQMHGRIGSDITRGIWIQALISSETKTGKEDKYVKIRSYTGRSMGQLILPLSSKKNGLLGLPDIKQSIKSQRLRKVHTDVLQESKQYPEIAKQVKRWKFLRCIQHAIAKLAPEIIKKLEETIKFENWNKKILGKLESVQCE